MIVTATTGPIDLSIPAQPDLLQLVRLTAGVVGARADLGLDAVEDLRLAVDELCLSLMGPTGRPGRLVLRYQWDDEAIRISCTLVAGDGDPNSVHEDDPGDQKAQAEMLRQEFSSQILDALVDEHGETRTDGHPGVWLTMRLMRPETG